MLKILLRKHKFKPQSGKKYDAYILIGALFEIYKAHL